jgi:Zn-dependent alcohol dehydrogenase
MAIVNCPKCEKKISSQTMLCPYCGFQRSEVAEEALKEFRRRKLRDRVYHLKMASYAALTLLIGAFAWYLTDTAGFQHRASMGPYVLSTIGAALYLVIRVYLFKSKAALRKIGP